MYETFIKLLPSLPFKSVGLFMSGLLQKKELSKLNNLKSAYSTFDKFETDFEKNFLEHAQKEACFFIETGIETNYISIPKFIEFKDRLGLRWNWRQIKEVLDHLDLRGEKIKINLSTLEKICTNAIVVLFFILVFSGIVWSSCADQYKTPLPKYLLSPLLFIIPALCGYFLVIVLAGSRLTAMTMERRLNSLQKNLNES